MKSRTVQLKLPIGPDFNTRGQIKAALSATAKFCGLSRAQIVDDFNRLANFHGLKNLSEPVLDKYLAAESDRVPSPDTLVLLCSVMKDAASINEMLKPLGLSIINEEDAKKLAFAEAIIKSEEARKEKIRLKKELNLF